MRRFGAALAVVLLTLTVCACSGGQGGAASGLSRSKALTVSAAASLRAAFERYAQQLGGAGGQSPSFSFAGSDLLAAQIRQGIAPDLFASANVALPEALYVSGLVSRPVIFAANRLVLAVPAGSTRIESLADVEKPGVTLAIGSAGVPVGAYTRIVLGRLGPDLERAVIANVRDEEPDVSGIVGKLSEGAIDAGFTYRTDVRAARGMLRAIELPAALQPDVAYAAAIVKGAEHRAQARAFIKGLLRGQGARDLLEAGFEPPSRR